MKQAEWNDITWGSSSNQMAHISNFTISQKVKTEEQQAQNGENKVTIKGIDSEELTVSYIAGFPVGLDPRGEFDMFKKCVGMQDEFLLAGSPISDTQFELDEVELGNTVLSDTGRVLSGEITLKFNSEKDPSSKGGKGKKKSAKKGKGKKKSGSLTLAPSILAGMKG